MIPSDYIFIHTDTQRLELYENRVKVLEFPISTALKGLGEENNSEKTPRGWHKIRAKIGENAEKYTVFKGRRPTGEIYTPELGAQNPDRDWILTRILWLSGLEPGLNRHGSVDTMRRFIYIHGCPDEISLEKPLSHGCIRMHNEAMITLFNRVPVGIHVYIGDTLRGMRMNRQHPLIIGLPGTTLSAKDISWIKHPAVGGIILFSHNFESKPQVKQLCRDIHSHRRDIFISVDHEGGRVQRFKEGFTEIPPMGNLESLYAQDPQMALNQAKLYAEIIATELHEVGINLNFAPVLDLNYNRSEVIGNRAFASDPAVVTDLARSYIAGSHSHEMLCCGKHFPGHGFVEPDSHVEDPVDARPLSALLDNDLLPYRELREELDAIMTAHILFPEVDSDIVTYSSVWLKDILRDQLGYQGLIISDDLVMHAAAKLSPLERVYKALDAGCDMVLYCKDYEGIDEILSDYELDLKRA